MAKAAASITRYSRFFRHSKADNVLDYGAGTLRNSLYLAQHGFKVYAADLPEPYGFTRISHYCRHNAVAAVYQRSGGTVG